MRIIFGVGKLILIIASILNMSCLMEFVFVKRAQLKNCVYSTEPVSRNTSSITRPVQFLGLYSHFGILPLQF